MEVEEGCPVRLSFEDIREYTDNFKTENLIGEFQFGKVYHGNIIPRSGYHPKRVTIKVWEIPTKYEYYEGDNTNRLMDELIFLQQPKISHPLLMKLYGYCCQPQQWCIVYDFKSFNTLHNLIHTDDFKWGQRIKVALRFAHLLRFLHVQTKWKEPLIIRNIDAAHIMVDEDWNPKLYDLSMVTGCMFPDRTLYKIQHVHGSYGYSEPLIRRWSKKSDVYGFGVLLLCLITKEVPSYEGIMNSEPCVIERALTKCIEAGEANFKMSMVHKSFEADESFCAADGPSITRLAVSCLEYLFCDRPKIDRVVTNLQKLKVVRRHLNPYVEKEKPSISRPLFN